MLGEQENQRLTEVGPGSAMGKLLRWYWHPIAAATQLDENPVKAVRLLGESLVLYRDRTGRLGLVSSVCAHRRVSLAYGIPEPEGLRCAYHGWLYDHTGQCLEMPVESPESSFAGKVKITAYPVQELCGLIFAYLGPQPAPLLPRWDLFVCDNMLRDIGFQVIPCNWLQLEENNVDPSHVQWLHGYFSNYVLERLGRPDLKREQGRPRRQICKWESWEHGILKRSRAEGETEDTPRWRIGSGLPFPNIDSVLTNFQYRVPMDDSHTLHVYFSAYPQPPGEVVRQDKVPYYEVPLPRMDGDDPVWEDLDSNGGQDAIMWLTQGVKADRTKEKLGESDRGVIFFRDLLRRQLDVVEQGGEPFSVLRDPAKNVRIDVPRYGAQLDWDITRKSVLRRANGAWKYSPIVTEMVRRHLGEEVLREPIH